jgi:hypothetical protein
MAKEDYETLKAKFLKRYANIPLGLREDTIVLINDEPISWNTAMIEIKSDSEIGKQVIKILRKWKII